MITNRTARASATSGSPASRSLVSIGATVLAAIALVLAFASPAAASETDDIYSGLNSARAAAGTSALAHNEALDSVALAWANQMAANNAMSHNPNTGAQIPAGWSGWGENVAYGFATGAATGVGWTNSPGHYANMVGDFTDVGIAFVSAGGTTWAVEVFAKYSSTPAAVSSAALTTTALTHEAAETAPASRAAAFASVERQPIDSVPLVALPLAIAIATFLVIRSRRTTGRPKRP